MHPGGLGNIHDFLLYLPQDFMGKSDPFLQISKVKPDGGALLVHRTEVRQNHFVVNVILFDKIKINDDGTLTS